MASELPPEPGAPAPPPNYGSDIGITSDARTLATLAHVLGIFTSFIGPIIIWLLKKDDPFVNDQAKEAMNFQITILLLHFLSGLLWCVMVGMIITPLLFLVTVVLGIMAAMKSNQGVYYRYPFCLRLIN